ncbi:LCP family protein [Gulosibacter chungangensis]|uniref:LytR family transcriptional regulator n=1 Tax=Gulosibacter chungangensis TaxID=979746 RepID=A0A7J5BFW7_9MICO|nr:LCP family protein [Gulosibacter chungangensis]KAB1644998.1 LytR family transcriptional regulator [Gulosibacter chungangensis]
MARHPANRDPQQLRLGGTMARHGRLPTTTVMKSLGKGIAMVMGVILVSAVTFGGIVYANLQSGVETFELADNSEQQDPTNIFEGGVNILLVGSDSRADADGNVAAGQSEGVLNDVNMIFHLSEDHSNATVVSIPRDTLVSRPDCTGDDGEQHYAQDGVMINSILNDGGMNCIVSTVEEMSGIDIQYAGMIMFNGVIEMSNAVGGVEVCVEQPINDTYSDLYLDAGYHSLQGEEALKFLRTRHGVGDGSDLARIENQQVFLSSLMRTVKSNETLTNPTKVYGLARAATQNMVLSSNLNSVDTLVSLANALAQVPLNQFTFVRLPVVDSEWQAGRVEPAYPDADQMWELIANDQPLNLGAGEEEPADAGDETSDAGEGSEDGSESTADDSTSTAEGSDEVEGPGVTQDATPTPDLSGQTADTESCSNSGGLF